MILKLSSLCADSWWYNWPIPFSPHKEPTCRVYSPGGCLHTLTRPFYPQSGQLRAEGGDMLSGCAGTTERNGERSLSSGDILG